MTSTDPTPTLIPGVPASTWGRAASGAIFFTIPVYLAFGYFRLIAHDGDLSVQQWFVPLISYAAFAFGAVLLFGILSALSARREAAAGYTTQWRSQPTLPQLDARTGALVRAAGQPYVKRSDWRERVFAGGSVPTAAADVSPWGQNKPGPWAGLAALLPGIVVALVATAGAAGYTGIRGGTIVERVVITVIVLAVILAVFLGIGAAVVGGRLRRLAAIAPSDFVFVFAKSKGYADAFAAQAVHDGPASGYGDRGVSANADGLTVWEGTPYKQVLHFHWDVITAIQVDTVPGGNQRNNMVLVTFKSHGGPLATLPLAYAKFNSFPLPSKAGTTWIVAQLNGLREHKTTTQVI